MGLNIQDLRISSTDFDRCGRLDARHAYDRDNEAPTLRIEGVPDGTVELALICHDPDAPLPDGFTHWALYGIPADTTEIGAGADETFRPGPNDFGGEGYGGPQPPPGHGTHHYYFWVYALSAAVEGNPSRREFLDRHGHDIIEQNRVVGTYEN
jgi:Raf kinase inhibitor-like YbhB/YbcL family protein